MLRIVVDSGSSVKQEEKDAYPNDILPIQIELGEESFLDGVNLDINEFYEKLKQSDEFPKTSLPALDEAEKLEAVRALDVAPEEDGTIIITRKIMAGKSMSRINDEAATLSKLPAHPTGMPKSICIRSSVFRKSKFRQAFYDIPPIESRRASGTL